ncbi:ethanolamine ammonia-lyase subunit EutC [Reichenbachiella agarivorans]|uniref:Ethanolamine ammonia-lyase small subunit n=1 Tax=Reichenbachiella agarivorans TaxID=2979464 RepID=A0ABY6CNR0_9BACT|nr:ethanolamine ammonia-lyase subunit EutC [Reichenbachiella agarivorans]UXP31675.1 ethanolamine ammonia-lyase subunit EutC [Reichenbachiella agarivorans]
MSKENVWERFKSLTDARVALGRAGGSLKTAEMLLFRRDHALASDAVKTALDTEHLIEQLAPLSMPAIVLHSQATDRTTYIQRPDLGRVLDDASSSYLVSLPARDYDINIILADGLSALAIAHHAWPFLQVLIPLLGAYTLAPLVIVKQGRVAISDPIGQSLGSKLSVILIGERPGLSSPDSMGIYLTYHPRSGNTDEKRNCISNVRSEGLSYEYAAHKLAFLVTEALRRKLSGVQLKDTYDGQLLNYDRSKE